MAKGFDGLIEYLLEEIALCGEIGTSLGFDHPKTFRDRSFRPGRKDQLKFETTTQFLPMMGYSISFLLVAQPQDGSSILG